MKTLGFRVYDKDLACYVKSEDGSGRDFSDYVKLKFTDTGVELDTLCPGRYVFERDTGTKDKNGKPIYEGDIIAADCGCGEDYARVAEVYYDEGIPGFDAYCLRGGIDNYFSFIEEYKVVGNIHEDEWKNRWRKR